MENVGKSPLRLGILGCGSFIQRRILTLLHEIPAVKVTCLYKRDYEIAKQLATQFHIPYVTKNQEDLIKHPEVDMVFIGSSNEMHKEQALACATFNKPVLCEKPMAPNKEDAHEMLEVFKKNNLLLLIGHSLRFKPALQCAQKYVKEEKLGTLQNIRARFSLPLDQRNWRFSKDRGGGALQDIGIHLIDLIRFVSGQEIVSVIAKGKPFDFDNSVEKTVTTLMTLSEGSLASLECSFEQPFHSGFEVLGSKGQLISLNSLRQTYDPIESLCLISEDDTKTFLPLKASNIFVEELNHVAHVFHQQEDPLISAENGLRNVEVVEAIYASLREKREIELP